MQDHEKTRDQLVDELNELRSKVAELESIEVRLVGAQNALRESEQMLKGILSASPIGIVHSRDREIIWANHAWEEMFGFGNEQEYIGLHTSIMHPSEVEYENVRSMLYDNVRRGQVSETDAMLRRKDGSVFGAHIKISLLDPADSARGTISAIADISERKASQAALKESEEKYRLVVEKVQSGILVAQDGMLRFVNHSAIGILGRDSEELLSKPFTEFIHQDHIETILKHHLQRMKGQEPPGHYFLKIVRKDGDPRWVEADAGVLSWEGRPAALVCIADVTERKRTDEALLNEKTLTDSMIDSLPGVFYLFDTEGRFLRWNKNFERVSGRSAEEILAMRPSDFISHEHKLAVEGAIREVFEAGEATIEADFFSKDGSKIPHLFTGKRINFGLAPCLVGMGIDTTALKLAEEDLREKTEMLRSMFQASPEAIIVLDPQGIVKMWNPSAERTFGWTESEALGCLNPVVPDSKQDEFRMLRERVLRGESFSGVELTRRTKDGTVIEISVSTAPLKGPDGNVEGILSVSADITKRKRSEEVQRRLATAIEQSIEAVMITDRNGIIQYVNPAFENISGYRKEEAIGRNTRFLKSDRHDSSYYKDPLEAIRSGKPWKGRLVSQRKDGRIFYEDAAISPVRDSSGEIVNFVDVGHDVTENVELQKQLLQAQKMEAVGTLAGGIAHDFNNILQAVLGYSEFMIRRKKEGEPDYADLQKICKAGNRGADLVKSLMTFSRKLETKYIPVNLNQEIAQAQDLLFCTIPKTIKIDLHLNGDLESIKADPSQIGQILMNLGVNARDAMPDGGTLTIETGNVQLDKEYCSAHLEAIPGSYVLLSVSDTGQGMDKKTLSHIFEPFFSTKEVGKGTGLGLATVYGIVKQHGGHIMCYSEPGHGTTFRIYLPAIQTKNVLETPISETAIRGGTETILLVEDEEDIRDLGATLLNEFGYKVIKAGNGKEALEIYRMEKDRISLILLDLIMPVMDGRQCLAEILRIDPEAKVIIASGYSESGPTDGVMGSGAKGFVQKPYNMRQLLTTIRETLDQD